MARKGKVEGLTLAEISNILNSWGLRISKRTIRHWAKLGLIPKPVVVSFGRYGARAFYPEDALAHNATVYFMRNQKLEERRRLLNQQVIEVLNYPGYPPLEIVEVLERVSKDGKTYTYKRLRSGGILVQARK